MSIWQSLTTDEKLATVREGLLGGLSISAIARSAGAPDGTIATLIHRHHLRSWLQDELAARARAALATGPLWQDMNRNGRVAAIRAGIAAGLTAAAIARHHGTTRNAICGAANRAGLRFSAAAVIELAEWRGSPDAHAADGATKQQAARGGLGPLAALPAATDAECAASPGSEPPAAAGRMSHRPASPLPAAAAKAADGSLEPAPRRPRPERPAAPAPEPVAERLPTRVTEATPGSGRGLMDLGFGMCRYPLWGRVIPAAGEERFCSAPVVAGSSWCAEHRAVCVAGTGTVPKALLRAVDNAGRRAGR